MMKSKEDLRNMIRRIDHKSYGMYKSLAGSYKMGRYILHIDHVQGDPFASPSRLRIEVPAGAHGFPPAYIEKKDRRIALEDRVLRIFQSRLRKADARSRGSGKSGRISSCTVGQSVLERIAVHFTEKGMEFRFEAGFPAGGRIILGREMDEMIFKTVDDLARTSLLYESWSSRERERLKKDVQLAEDQRYIRDELDRRGLVAFVADGSILPRESGISDRPMKDAIPFTSPDSLRVVMELPHGGRISGMGIPEGITVIVGGGYHGKSTLLKALERGVYNHVAGDGREYVITRDHAMKVRAEDGRCVMHTDISLFIRNLPNGQDTRDFSTENASGSTSQAASLVEAIEAGSGLLLLDEDTSATNFMIRDQVMARLVSEEQEPISTLLSHIRALRRDMGMSFLIVVGSSGDYLSVADLVLQLDHYHVRDVTQKALAIVKEAGIKDIYAGGTASGRGPGRKLKKRGETRGRRMKLKAMGTDSVMINRDVIDVRHLEQLSEPGQTICMAYYCGWIFSQLNRDQEIAEVVENLYEQIEKEGMLSVIPAGYSCGHPVWVRKQELYACINRYREAGILL